MNNLIIGIAGGSGSGKTTLALRLKERFGEDCTARKKCATCERCDGAVYDRKNGM